MAKFETKHAVSKIRREKFVLHQLNQIEFKTMWRKGMTEVGYNCIYIVAENNADNRVPDPDPDPGPDQVKIF